MSDTVVASAIVVVMLAANAIGKYLRAAPEEGRRTWRETGLLIISILVLFTALLFGLVISEVKGSFETFDSRLTGLTGDITRLETGLREYGGEAIPIQAKLRAYLAAEIAQTWPDETPPPGADPTIEYNVDTAPMPPGELLAAVDAAIQKLEPTDPYHRQLAVSLKSIMSETLQQRRMVVDSERDRISWPLLIGATAWLAIVFAALGLLAPRKVAVQAAIVFGALSFASAVYIIIEFDRPLDGAIRVSSAPSWEALRHLDGPLAVVP
jgi:hypothetical protein